MSKIYIKNYVAYTHRPVGEWTGIEIRQIVHKYDFKILKVETNKRERRTSIVIEGDSNRLDDLIYRLKRIGWSIEEKQTNAIY